MGNASEPGAIAFDASYFARLDAARDHWWVRGMGSVATALLDDRRTDLDVLDAGAGTGANVELVSPLAGCHRVRAIDVAWPAVVACAARYDDVDVVQASVVRIPFDSEAFDLVVCMDVLQHLPRADVGAALAEMWRVLRPRGRLLLRTGAAFGQRHAAERDDWRLYRPRDLSSVVGGAGFHVLRTTHANSLPGLWASVPRPWRRLLARGQPHEHAHGGEGLGIPAPVPRWKNAVLGAVLSLEARWLAHPRRRLPLGHSLYVLAEKP